MWSVFYFQEGSDNIMSNSKKIENNVRSFSMYEVLEKPLLDYISEGDGIHALPVYVEDSYPYSDVVDTSLINLIKLISTAFGRKCVPQAYRIIERIHSENSRKKTFRFRSRHPLYVDGTPKYQNVCLVSGMVHLGIPILPYFDGEQIIEIGEDVEDYLNILRDSDDLLL